MARSRESDRTYQPRYQYGIRKPLSVNEPTAEYFAIPAGLLDRGQLPRHNAIRKKHSIFTAIQRYREKYG